MKRFAGKYFSFILLLAGIIGLIIPYPGDYAPYFILLLLFTIIFASSFRFKFNKEIIFNNSRKAIIFTFLRFIIIPLISYYLISFISEFYAFALFFLLIIPSAVAAPPVTALLTKNINLSLLILILSSIISVITIPLFIPLFSDNVSDVHPQKLFITLFFAIILPFMLHLPFRKNEKINTLINNNLSLITVFCVSMIMLLAISGNKQFVFDNPDSVLIFGIISLVLFLGLYTFGWFIIPKQSYSNRVNYSISSGLNNIGLAISLSAIYLPPILTVFCIVAQITWIISLIPVRLAITKIYSSKNF